MKRIPILPLLVFPFLILAGCASAPTEEPSPQTPDESAVPQESLAALPADVDLRITSLAVNCGAAPRPGSCSVNVTVSNEGSDAADGLYGRCVYVFMSDQYHPQQGGVSRHGYGFVLDGYLAAKNRAGYRIRFTPARGSDYHKWECEIDPDNAIHETNEGNNRMSAWMNRPVW
jgi:hypothetical protein